MVQRATSGEPPKGELTRFDTKRPFHRTKTASVIADAVAEFIFARRLAPGTVLATEAQMIAEFGVGRATLREALRLLEAEGLVVVRAGPNGGAVVQQPTPDRLARLLSTLLSISGTSLREVAEARLLIEPELSARAARSASPAALLRLEEAHERLRHSVEADPEEALDYHKVAADFHTVVAQASGNTALSAFSFALSRISDGQPIGVHYGYEPKADALRAHEKIMVAIRLGDPEKASAAMRKHMAGHLAYLRRAYPDLLEDRVRMVNA